MKYDYEVIVVGAGSWWLTVAFGLAAAGKKVALVERWLIGGDCTNFGCVPSKALIDIAKSWKYDSFSQALSEVRKRRKIIQDEETIEKIEAHGLKVIQGYASFVDDHTLHVDGQDHTHISGEKIVLSTWSHAMKIDIEGVDTDDILTNETIFEQTKDIKNLVVVGGWYIGCELAESISALWVNVHLVQRNTYLIPREEEESSKLLQEIFESKGIHVHTGSHLKSAKWKKLTITDIHGEWEKNIPYDKILIALGRISNVEKLQLENAGVVYSKKGISVDGYNRTNIKHIFAIGDCVEGNPQFTHWANNEGRGVIRNILVPFPKKSVRNAVLPAVLYTHLEVARIGRTEKELKQRFDSEEFVTKTISFSSNDRSKVTEDTTGFIKIHFKRLSGRILGATIFGKWAGEMLPILTSAMDNRISAYALAKTIQPYPTKSDLIKRVCDAFVVGTISNIKTEIRYFFHSYFMQIITAIIWISIIGFFFWYKSTHNLSFEDMALGFYNFIWGTMIGPIIYIFAYAVRPVILFPATLMTFMSGALFGFVGGFIFTWIGETMSAIFAYFLWNVFGKKLLTWEESGLISTLRSKVNKEPFMSILTARFLFFPFDLTNYISGFLKVKFPSYVAATALGIIPGMSVFILAGAAFHNKELTSLSDAISNIDITMLYYAAGLFILTVVFAKVLKKMKK